MGRKILLVTTDQQRFDTLACNGGTLSRTPVNSADAACRSLALIFRLNRPARSWTRSRMLTLSRLPRLSNRLSQASAG